MCDQQRLRPACAYAQSDQSLCLSLEYSMTLKLLTKHYFEFLILLGGSMGSSGFTLIKMAHCWKSHVTAHLIILDGQAGRKTLQQCKTISLPLDALIKVINKLTIITHLAKTGSLKVTLVGFLATPSFGYNVEAHKRSTHCSVRVWSMILTWLKPIKPEFLSRIAKCLHVLPASSVKQGQIKNTCV